MLNDWIIDLGCGDGAFSEAALDGFQMIGTDLSKQQLDMAKRRKVYHSVVLADATLLPLRSFSVRTIISISALEHIPELDRVFREIYRVLRRPGILLFTGPARALYNDAFFISQILNPLSKINYIKKLRQRYIKKMENSLSHLHYFNSTSKERLLNLGFSDVKVHSIIPARALSFWSIIWRLEHHMNYFIIRTFWCPMMKIFDRILSELCCKQKGTCLCFKCEK